MRALLILVVCLALLSPGLATIAPHRSTHDPCDSYGGCVSSSITYTRANPDDSLYPGDQFTIALSITLGGGSTGCGSGCSESWSSSLAGVTWSFDQTEFQEASISETSAAFTVVGNSTGTYTISATASFLVTIVTCVTTGNPPVTVCSTSYAQSSLNTTQQATVIQLELQVSTRIVNMTDRATGYVLRNPDGSFYRNDSFCVQWNATFQFSDVRKDINVSVLSVPLSSLILLNSSSTTVSTFAPGNPGVRQGMFCYGVALDAPYQPYNLTLSFEAINWLGMSIARTILVVPFAVVQFSPSFTYFTYMDYNSKNSTAYARPFATLVRYGGNDPGYSYGGDSNTAPIINGNDTGERAYINNFTFATTGWNTTLRLVSANIGKDLTFASHYAPTTYHSLNKTYSMITWAHRVQKYYLKADFREPMMLFYNTTTTANSVNFAGMIRTPLFNTTYLYGPARYSGYVFFKFYNADGKPDTAANITIVSHNPSPLNTYLFSRVRSTFGNDLSVMKAFNLDLYPSNSTIELRQLHPNQDGTITYLVNQTNLAMTGDDTFPWFSINVSSRIAGASYTFMNQPPYLTGESSLPCSSPNCNGVSYQVPGSWSLFFLTNTTLTSLPFPNATSYYLQPVLENLALPLNSTLPGGHSWYVNWYGNTTEGPVIDGSIPASLEPGQLTTLYQFIYGQNATVNVNTMGGGFGLSPPAPAAGGGGYYQLGIVAGPGSGGLTHLWVVDSEGKTLTNQSLLPTTPTLSSFSMPGYFGVYTAEFPVVTNGTMTLTMVNSWGAKTVVQGIPVTVHLSTPPQLSSSFVILMTLILLGIGSLSTVLIKKNARRKESD